MLIMEEIDQESMKHMYKLCDKSFSCERLLGGHMMINSSNDQNEMENKSVFDKLCEKCGKGFQSWKALFGHMKCHSTKLSNNKNKNIASFRQDSCASHSYNENLDSKKRRIKRSRSRNKRYMVASNTTSSSISMSVNNNNNQFSSNNAPTSMVSEIEQEQEVDVAMSLMMLSGDLGKWGNELESSYLCNSSVFVNLGKVEGKDLTKNGSKMKKQLVEPQVSLDSFGEYENSSKRKYDCVTCNKSFHSSQALGGHKASHKKKLKGDFDTQNKIKHKPMLDHDQTTKGYDSKACDIHQEASSFNLGGHKASHKKKLEGGFDTKTKIKHKPMLDHDQTTKGYDSKACDIHQEASSFNLGGHKASHKKKLEGGFDTKTKIKHKPMLDHDQTTKGYDSKACDIHQEASSFNLGEHKASHKKKLEGGFDTKTKIKHKPMLDHDQTTKGYDSKACDIHQEASSFNLGGHKASHKKKLKGDFDTKNKIKHKPMLDHDQTTKGYDSKTCDIHQEASSFNLGGVGFSKKKTVVFGTYECPICYKIFASGQALGGHKRAHLNQEMNTNVTKKADEHLQKTRGFFDLNMFPDEDMNMTNITMNPDYY